MRSLPNYCVDESSFISSEDENSTMVSSLSKCNDESNESFLKECEDNVENLNSISNVDKELMEKIVSQVEAYFSDENLIKDEFLLKHIRRNKEGFVSLKLVSSLRKVKALSKDWKIVAYCIEHSSKKLEVNANYTKIRRINPLPNADGSKCSRTVIAYNIPSGKDNVEHIRKTFSQFGEIALIRILRADSCQFLIDGNVLHANHQNIIQYDPNVLSTIEFYNKTDAENAVRGMNSDNNWRNSMKVTPMKPNTNTRTAIKSGITCAPKLPNNDSYSIKQNIVNGKKQNKFSYKYESTHRQTNNSNIHLLRRQKSNSYSAGDEASQQKTNLSNGMRSTNSLNSTHNSRLPANVIRTPYGPDGHSNGFKLNRQRSYSQP